MICSSAPYLHNRLYTAEVRTIVNQTTPGKTIHNQDITFLQSHGSLEFIDSKIVESVQFHVINLQPGITYQVCVTANNREITSDPLVITVKTQDKPEDHAAETKLKNSIFNLQYSLQHLIVVFAFSSLLLIKC